MWPNLGHTKQSEVSQSPGKDDKNSLAQGARNSHIRRNRRCHGDEHGPRIEGKNRCGEAGVSSVKQDEDISAACSALQLCICDRQTVTV